MPSRFALSVHSETWVTRIPFKITGYTFNAFDVVVVELTDGRHVGRGEGLPIFYLGETIDDVRVQIEALAQPIAEGMGRKALLGALPPGGARNALDCALWDLEAKTNGRTIWELTGIVPKSVAAMITIGIEESPNEMARRAREAAQFPLLKIKVNHDKPVERVAAIRAARPDATLTVDANQGWSLPQLVEVAPRLAELGVKLIEQPLARGRDDGLDNYTSPVPLCADESCQHEGDLAVVARRYQIVNIKLDKIGGLTAALDFAQSAKGFGCELLVSNMGGTSLSMAPAFVLAQVCKYAELDGQFLLKHDRLRGLESNNGRIAVPDTQLWG